MRTTTAKQGRRATTASDAASLRPRNACHANYHPSTQLCLTFCLRKYYCLKFHTVFTVFICARAFEVICVVNVVDCTGYEWQLNC